MKKRGHKKLNTGSHACSHSQAQKNLYRKHPELRGKKNPSHLLLENFTKKFTKEPRQEDVNYTIPLVFHVVHDNGVENISDAQIHDAILQLNEDFTVNDAIGDIDEAFTEIVASVGIEFRLAEKDPDGDPTDGINRIQSELTYNGSQISLKELIQWEPTKYLNIWVVYSLGNFNGSAFAYYPADADAYPIYDGVVSSHWGVGRTGTAVWTHYKILTHEIGHWANLKHTWGDQSGNQEGIGCEYDDGVTDTPNTTGNTGCDVTATSCGNLDNIQNYMDYSDCSNMFTEGQKTRMLACLNSAVAGRNNIWSASNLEAVFFEGTVPRIFYERSVFYESGENDGSIVDSISINLLDTLKFVSTVTNTILNSSFVTFGNVPSGLSLSVNVIDETHARLMVGGTAVEHNASDSISNIEVHFNTDVFQTTDIYNPSKTNIGITFIPPYEIVFVDLVPDVHNFLEGQSWKWFAMISGIAEFVLFHIKESDSVKIKLETYSNKIICNGTGRNITPLSYGAVIGNSQIFQENTEPYPDQFDLSTDDWCDSTAFAGISFQKNGNSHYGWIRLHISADCRHYYALDMGYNEKPGEQILAGQVERKVLAYSNTQFHELDSGSIASTHTITIFGGSFSNPNTNGLQSSNIYEQSNFTITGMPSGLTAQLEFINPTEVHVSFTGAADLHTAHTSSMDLVLDSQMIEGDTLGMNLTQTLSIDFIDIYHVEYVIPSGISVSHEDNWIWFSLGIGDAEYGLWYNDLSLRLETYAKSAICEPLGDDFEVKALEIGSIIGNSSDMGGGNQWVYTTELEQQPIINSEWNTAYAGVKFTIAENFHYGWLQISVTNIDDISVATLIDYAYNSKPGEPIMAGQKLANYGCMNPLALNYNPNATSPYGDCTVCNNTEIPVILMMTDSYGDGWNNYYLKFQTEGVDVKSFTLSGGYDGSIEFCLEPGSYTYEMVGGSYPDEIAWELKYNGEVVASEVGVGSGSFDIQNIEPSQNITLPLGWSIISTYMEPEYSDIESVFEPVVSDLIIVKDYLGNIYLPGFENFNNIGTLTIGHGYQCKMSQANQLLITGTILQPEENEITLMNGWNILGYLRIDPSPCESVFSEIINKIVIVKDFVGNVYLPDYYGFNNIGNLKAGEGYQIKVAEECTLTYNSNTI